MSKKTSLKKMSTKHWDMPEGKGSIPENRNNIFHVFLMNIHSNLHIFLLRTTITKL